MSEGVARLVCAALHPLLKFLLDLHCSIQILHALLPLSLLPWLALIPRLRSDLLSQGQIVWVRLPDLYLSLLTHHVLFVLAQLKLSANLTSARSPRARQTRETLGVGEPQLRRVWQIVFEGIYVVV